MGRVAEEERSGERRGDVSSHIVHADAALGDVGEQALEALDVEDVAQALAIRLEQDRKTGVAGGDREQVGRSSPLQPQGRAPTRVPPRQQQRSGRVFAEVGREEGRGAQLPDDLILDLFRAGKQPVHGGRFVRFGEAKHDSVVAPDQIHFARRALAEPLRRGHGPRRSGRAPRRGTRWRSANRQLRRENTRRRCSDRRALRPWPAPGRRDSGADSARPAASRVQSLSSCSIASGRGRLEQPPDQRPIARPNSSGRPGPSPRQNGIRPGFARGGGDQDSVLRDIQHAPGRRAQQKHVTGFRLEDHLFVELADTAAGSVPIREIDAVQSPIRNRPRVRHGDMLGSPPRRHEPRDPIPGHARSQVGEIVRRVTAREKIQDSLEAAPRQIGEGGRAADGGVERVDRDRAQRHHGHQLLSQHVERIAGIARRLDFAPDHLLRGRRAGHQIAAILGKNHARRRHPT